MALVNSDFKRSTSQQHSISGVLLLGRPRYHTWNIQENFCHLLYRYSHVLYCFPLIFSKCFIALLEAWHNVFIQLRMGTNAWTNFVSILSLILVLSSILQHFYTPWKLQETLGFLTFSGSIEMLQDTGNHWSKLEHWYKIG